MKKNPNNKIKYNQGMTLVELLVVLVLFVIVASLTIFDYGRFRSSVSLQNLADDISLSIRRAQNYAIGVRSAQSSDFEKGYGIHFSMLAPSGNQLAGSNKSFIIFSDLNGSNAYEYTNAACNTNGSECVDLLTITSSDIISSICTYDVGSSVCTPRTNVSADITFHRPNPDANICIVSPGFGCETASYSSVDIVVQNLESHATKTINVSNVGQISIK